MGCGVAERLLPVALMLLARCLTCWWLLARPMAFDDDCRLDVKVAIASTRRARRSSTASGCCELTGDRESPQPASRQVVPTRDDCSDSHSRIWPLVVLTVRVCKIRHSTYSLPILISSMIKLTIRSRMRGYICSSSTDSSASLILLFPRCAFRKQTSPLLKATLTFPSSPKNRVCKG